MSDAANKNGSFTSTPELPPRSYRPISSMSFNTSTATIRLIDLTRIPVQGRRQALVGLLEDSRLGERREHARRRHFTAVDYVLKDRVFRDFVKDIGLGGLFIETREPFNVGQELLVLLPTPGSRESLRALCEVVRVGPLGIGVKFKLESKWQRQLIENILQEVEP